MGELMFFCLQGTVQHVHEGFLPSSCGAAHRNVLILWIWWYSSPCGALSAADTAAPCGWMLELEHDRKCLVWPWQLVTLPFFRHMRAVSCYVDKLQRYTLRLWCWSHKKLHVWFPLWHAYLSHMVIVCCVFVVDLGASSEPICLTYWQSQYIHTMFLFL